MRLTRRRLMSSTALFLGVGALSLIGPPARAQSVLPRGGSVAAGDIRISAPAGNALTVTQSSARGVINWNSFSVGQQGSVTFVQPNASAATLNRVTGSATSAIAGQIHANGQVYLVNPNGIAITATGAVKVGGGFVASTLGITDPDFMNGNLRFSGSGASAGVTNAGKIRTRENGFVALIGGTVANAGTISVPLGKVGLGSGERATLDLGGDGFLQVAVPTGATAADGGALVDVSGKVEGSRVELRAATVASAIREAVNVSGVVSAKSVSGHDGSITLSGDEGGGVAISGQLSVAGGNKAVGGTIIATGHDVTLAPTAIVDASGTAGGTILIGGDRQGGAYAAKKFVKQTVQTAKTVTVAAGAKIRADGSAGAGGKVVLWSDAVTGFAGAIDAKAAGTATGGFVETSSKGRLTVADGATVNTLSAFGPAGDWLLDPATITVAANGADILEAAADTTNTVSVVTLSADTLNAATSNVILAASTSIAVNSAINLTNSGVGITFEGAGTPTQITAGPSSGTSLAANITTNNGAVTINGATVLGANTTISTGTAASVFNGTVNGAFSLTTVNSGGTTFAGTVGATTALSSLTTGTVLTTLKGNVTTNNGAVAFNGATVLSPSASLVTINAGTAGVTFAGTITGAKGLTVSGAGGATLFANASLTTSAGAFKITGPTTLGADITVTTAAAAITFTGAVDGAHNLTISNGSGGAVFSSTVGATTKLTSLRSTGAGTVSFGGNVSINNGSLAVTNSMALSKNITIDTGTGAFSVGKNLTGAFALILAGTGTSTFATSGTVSGLKGLVTGTGTTVFNGNIGTSNGAITVNGPATIGGNVLINAGTGLVTFNGAIEGAVDARVTPGVNSLTISISPANINSTVGATNWLSSLFIGTGAKVLGGNINVLNTATFYGPTTLSGNITTSNGAVAFMDATTLGSDATISSGSGAVTFASTLTGAHGLTIANSGITTFGGAVGGTNLLTGLSTGTGTTALNANIATDGNISIGGAATLGTDITLNAGTGTTTVTGAVNGIYALTIAGTGATNFNGGLSELTALNTGAGLTSIAGAMTVNGATVLNGDVTIAAGTAAVNFNGTVDGAHALTITGSGATTFGTMVDDRVGATTPLASLTTGTGLTTFNTDVTTNNGPITVNGAAQTDSRLTMTAGTGAISFLGTLDPVVDNVLTLTLSNSGATTFAGAVGQTNVYTGLTTGTGLTTLGGNIKVIGDITFNGPVVLGTDINISSSFRATTFEGTLDGPFSLTTTTGGTFFNGAVGATAPLASLRSSVANGSDGTGPTTTLGNITTTGAMVFGDTVALGGNLTTTNSSVTMNGHATLNHDVTIATGTGAISFNGTVYGAYNLSLLSSGSMLITGPQGPGGRGDALASLTTGTGPIGLAGDVVTTGAQNYGGAIEILGPLIMDGGSAAITFAGTIHSSVASTSNSLTVQTNGLATFNGAVDLAGLFFRRGTGASIINADITTAAQQDYTGPVTLNAATLTATGSSIRMRNTLTLGSDATLTSGGAQTYQAISGAHTLTLSGSQVTLNGAVGATTALTGLSTGTGLTTVKGNITTANGTVSFGGPVVLGAAVAIASGSGAVGFAGTLDGAYNLVLTNSGGSTFGNVGGTTRLTGLTTGTGLTTLGGAVNVDGDILFNGATALAANVAVKNALGTLTFSGAVDGSYILGITANLGTTFGGAVGTNATLTSLALASAATLSGNVKTAGPQVYGGAVTLLGFSTLSTSNATVNFMSTIDTAASASTPANLTVITGTGRQVYSSALGATKALGTLVLRGSNATGISLANTTNNFARVTILSGGVVTLADSGPLTLTSITATGDIAVTTTTGDLTLLGAVTTTAATATALLLQAGKSASRVVSPSASDSGGNVVFDGGSVSVGTGGLGVIYTGSIADSTGLSDAVIPGNFRYWSDTNGNTGYTTALTAGISAIYREQLVVTVAAAAGGGRVYDATTTIPVLTASGQVNGDAGSATGTITITGSGASLLNAGSYVLGVTGVSMDTILGGLGYAVQAAPDSTYVITPATLTYIADAATRRYGAADPALSGTVTGFAGSDSLTNATSGTLGFTTTATPSSNVGSYAIEGGGLTLNNGNYLLVQAAGNAAALSLTPALLTVTGSKTYDGTTGFATGQFALAGAQNGEHLTLSAGTALSGAADVGSYAAPLLGLTLAVSGGNALAANYTLAGSGTLAITPATITVTGVTAVDKTYDATAALPAGVPGFRYSGVIADNVTVTASRAAYDSADAGSRSIAISGLTINGAASGNYILSAAGVTGSGTITPATLTYRANAATRSYGAADAAASGSVTGFAGSDSLASATSGTLGFATTATALSNVGAYAITGSGLTANNGNYLLVQAAGNATALAITPAMITVAGATGINKIYDAASMLPDGIPGFLYSGVIGANVTLTASAAAYDSADAGSRRIDISGLTINGSAAGNYVLSATSVTGSGTITPATLTYTASAATRSYGAADPALSGTVTGFAGGDSLASATSGTLSFAAAATASSNVGAYAIEGSGLTANNGNYLLVQAFGNAAALAITPAMISVSGATGLDKVYDATTALPGGVPGFRYSGVIADNVTVTAADAAYDSANAGLRSIDISGLTINGAASGNYILSAASVTGSGTITPAILGVALTGIVEKTYDGTAAAALGASNYVLSGFVGAQSARVTQTSGRYARADTGSGIAVNTALGAGDFTAGQGTLLSNYELPVSASGVIGRIDPVTLFYAATPVARFIDTPNPAFTGTVTGFVGGETMASATAGTPVFVSPATASSPVGRYAVNGSGLTANAGNYRFAEAPENATALTVAPLQGFDTGAIVFLPPIPFGMDIAPSMEAAAQFSCTSGAIAAALEKEGSVVVFAPGGGCGG